MLPSILVCWSSAALHNGMLEQCRPDKGGNLAWRLLEEPQQQPLQLSKEVAVG